MPWFDIVKSLPVWAMVVGSVCYDWGVTMLLTSLPKYMAEVLKFDIKTVSLIDTSLFYNHFGTMVMNTNVPRVIIIRGPRTGSW